jgi:hypothetical protein
MKNFFQACKNFFQACKNFFQACGFRGPFYEYRSKLVYASIEAFEYCNTSIEILQYSGHPTSTEDED